MKRAFLLGAFVSLAALVACSGSTTSIASGDGGGDDGGATVDGSGGDGAGGGDGSSNNDGGGSDSGTSDSGGSSAQACMDLANAYCMKLDTCAPLFIQVAFGDLAACEHRAALACPATLAANGTSATTTAAEACAQAIPAAMCAETIDGKTPDACIP